jgi:Family of unknown function (DUF6603)
VSTAQKGLVQRAIGWIGGYLAWVKETLASDTAKREVLADLGYFPDTPAPLIIEDSQLTSIDAYRKNANPTESAFLSTWGDIVTVVEAIRGFVDASGAGARGEVDEALRQFLSLTGTEYTRLRYPTVYFALRLAGVFEDRLPTAFYTVSDELISTDVFSNLLDAIEAPFDFLGKVYSTPENDGDAAALAAATFIPLASLLAYWDHTAKAGLHLVGADFDLPKHKVLQGWDTFDGSPTPLADHLSSSVASFAFSGLDVGTTVQGTVGVTLAWVPRDAGGPGLFISLNGSANLKLDLGSVWKLDTKKSVPDVIDALVWDSIDINPENRPTGGGGPVTPQIARAVRPLADTPPGDGAAAQGILDAPLLAGEQVRFTLAPVHATPQEPYVLSLFGTRIELGKLSFTIVLADSGVELKLLAKDSALVVRREDGDGFVGKLLPDSGVRLGFDLGIGLAFTPEPRLFLEGGSGLQATLALNRSIGPARLQQLYLELATGSKVPAGGMRFESSIGASLTLGPITASVDRIGFQLTAGTDDGAPPAVGFKAPSGIGLLIDASVVTGGGYLFHDEAKGEYAGVIQLDFQGLTLQAIGLISSQFPDGRPGFSMLVIIEAANFPGIALGFGFRLTGVGGLLGYHRTVNVEPLRSGLKQGVLDNILFPENPVRDAPRIVSALSTIMPPQEDQFVYGFTARITWGVPTLVSIDLGIIYERPSPQRLLILGQFLVLLPSEEHQLVVLKLDAIGIVNFTTGEISVDATLYDSRITKFPITGDMALRARYKGDTTFALAIGGLHPKFSPPAGFPTLKRVAVGLSSSANAKLTLAAYMALTSNTAQVGARLDFLFKAAGFSVEGHLGFDALFTFSPFSFIVDIRAGVTLKWHGHTLFGVTLELTLSGPSPWRASGKATFEIWWFSKSVSFDHTFGDDEPPAELPAADPMPEVILALADPRNWSAQVPGSTSTLVSLREAPDDGVVRLHPLGELSVRQRVVPLGIEISKFGSGAISGDRRYDIAVLGPDGNLSPAVTPVLEDFAPGQFLDLSDDERLQRRSFERMGAGVRVGVSGVAWGGQADASLIGDADMTYETFVVGEPEEANRDTTVFVPTFDDLRLTAMFGAVARSATRHTGAARYRAAQQVPDVAEPAFAVVSAADLAPVAMPDIGVAAPSYTAARQALDRHLAEHPELAGTLQVVEMGAS